MSPNTLGQQRGSVAGARHTCRWVIVHHDITVFSANTLMLFRSTSMTGVLIYRFIIKKIHSFNIR